LAQGNVTRKEHIALRLCLKYQWINIPIIGVYHGDFVNIRSVTYTCKNISLNQCIFFIQSLQQISSHSRVFGRVKPSLINIPSSNHFPCPLRQACPAGEHLS
jgi:hypothetical protein